MPRQSSIKPLQEISEINMTPLIDLTFILLITFIITMPLIEQGIPIKLPQGKAQEVNENETRSITLDVEGRLYLDRVPVTLDELRQEMQVIGAAMPNTASAAKVLTAPVADWTGGAVTCWGADDRGQLGRLPAAVHLKLTPLALPDAAP